MVHMESPGRTPPLDPADEPLESLQEAFNRGEKLKTARPTPRPVVVPAGGSVVSPTPTFGSPTVTPQGWGGVLHRPAAVPASR
jgi:hypothetical protein